MKPLIITLFCGENVAKQREEWGTLHTGKMKNRKFQFFLLSCGIISRYIGYIFASGEQKPYLHPREITFFFSFFTKGKVQSTWNNIGFPSPGSNKYFHMVIGRWEEELKLIQIFITHYKTLAKHHTYRIQPESKAFIHRTWKLQIKKEKLPHIIAFSRRKLSYSIKLGKKNTRKQTQQQDVKKLKMCKSCKALPLEKGYVLVVKPAKKTNWLHRHTRGQLCKHTGTPQSFSTPMSISHD